MGHISCVAQLFPELILFRRHKVTVNCTTRFAHIKKKTMASTKEMFEDISLGEDDVVPPIVEENGKGAVVVNTSTHRSLHRSAHSSGMESSVLRFKNVNFIVGKKGEEKNILTDVSGTVRWGRKCTVECGV